MTHPDIAVVLGTRPEIIKLAPVVRELGSRAEIIHTGQHYDHSMSGAFFEQLEIPEPRAVLQGIGGKGRGTQIAEALQQLTDRFAVRTPKAVIVQGDTNAVSAGAQAANYLGIPVVHVEAGLRSHDRAMPEELNRLVAGALADVHCAATPLNAGNLAREGVDPKRIIVTGNTIVEATTRMLAGIHPDRARELVPWEDLPERWVLATIHRPENTDSPEALTRVLRGLAGIQAPVLFLAHPRTLAAMKRWGLADVELGNVTIGQAVGHAEFLALAASATLLVSDSGGAQEECTVLKKPLLVVRRSTERPEAMLSGFAALLPPHLDIAVEANRVLGDPGVQRALESVPSPYGDGHAAERIAAIAAHIADGVSPMEAIAEVAGRAGVGEATSGGWGLEDGEGPLRSARAARILGARAS